MTERLAYRIDEAAERVGVHRVTLYRWIATGKLRTTKIGGCRLVPASSLCELIEMLRVETNAPTEITKEATPTYIPPWARRKEESPRGTTWIYVVKAPRHVKIGISDDPMTRLVGLQVGSPYQLSLAYRAQVIKGNAEILESTVHNDLDGFKTSGEWFKVSIYKAVSAIARAADYLSYTVAACPSLCPSRFESSVDTK